MPKKMKDANKPKRGKSAYLFYSQAIRDQVKRDNPDLNFSDLGKLIGKMWGELSAREKKPYQAMADADKQRYQAQMATYVPPAGFPGARKARREGPKHPLSPYIFFTQAQREKVKNAFPDLAPKDIMAKLGAMWREMPDHAKAPYLRQADLDKERYAREKAAYEGSH
mmetsp:Transcript_20386/g.48210  ORF Transcript_20386/g.48210 Transcript_20386/m.48210 type:complete len:167 (+) Transcript_20386:75-575(+)